jgi:tRNA nucleotidyltransferase (CCA-adding enzyme)
VGATAAEMEALGYRRVGRDFPVFLHPVTHEEYALARRERKTAPGYTGFAFDAGPEVTLEEDLLRRDLTVNAMAESEDGSIIDPYGGQTDLAAHLLRHVSPAFAEDPVRILRTARFAARLDWAVAPDTLELMRSMVAAGEVDALVPERVWAEWERALGEPHPQRFIEVLQSCGALERLWPELADLLERPDRGGDLALACLRSAVARESDTRVRSAALLHLLPAASGADRASPDAPGCTTALEQLLDRMRAPNEFHELALLAARWAEALATSRALEGELLWDCLQKSDALRRPERFLQLAEVVAARLEAAVLRGVDAGRDAAGPGHGDRAEDTPGAGAAEAEATIVRLQTALAAARAIQAQPFLTRGLRGPALGDALAEARRQAVVASLPRQHAGGSAGPEGT